MKFLSRYYRLHDEFTQINSFYLNKTNKNTTKKVNYDVIIRET